MGKTWTSGYIAQIGIAQLVLAMLIVLERYAWGKDRGNLKNGQMACYLAHVLLTNLISFNCCYYYFQRLDLLLLDKKQLIIKNRKNENKHSTCISIFAFFLQK